MGVKVGIWGGGGPDRDHGMSGSWGFVDTFEGSQMCERVLGCCETKHQDCYVHVW